MMTQTATQYDQVITACRDIFEKKTLDYGTAWRILRPSSLTDQLFIKARRIRSIQEKGIQKVAEGVDAEFQALINYSVLALIQLELDEAEGWDLPAEQVLRLYDAKVAETRALMLAKNHDYGEVWREMRVSSLTDLILMKLLRVKQIEDNQGQTLISEGLAANYMDILNYAAFALIHLDTKSL